MKEQERNNKILDMYKNGATLQKIGTIFKFSRARAQQIVFRGIKKQIIENLKIKRLKKEEKKLLDFAVKEEIREIFSRRMNINKKKRGILISKSIMAKMKLIPHYSQFLTFRDFYGALGEFAPRIKRYFPEIAEYFLNKRRNSWSKRYNKCRQCGTVSIRHGAYGLCINCYHKSDEFKDMQRKAFERNSDRRRERNREYIKTYLRRPDVVARFKTKNDLRNFGGNRERAIERDNFMCKNCGITREKSLKIFKRDLYVEHINYDKTDNDLNNLKTVCFNCHNKRTIKYMRGKRSKNINKKIQTYDTDLIHGA